MRSVTLSAEILATIEREARSAYPDEACGFLLSNAQEAEGPVRTIVAAEPAPNEVDGERRRRFIISAAGLRSAELRAAARNLAVSGFYHSHPDHPARPSAFDGEHAWPWYTYLVTSVDSAGNCETASFELEPASGEFRPCELQLSEGAPPVEPVAVLVHRGG